MSSAETLEQSAMSHMAKARELHGVGDPAAADTEARLAVKQMRASARARLTPDGGTEKMTDAPTETFAQYFTRLRLAAGFAKRPDLAKAMVASIGGDKADTGRILQALMKWETRGILPRANTPTLKQAAVALGVKLKDLDPEQFVPGSTPASRGVAGGLRAAAAVVAPEAKRGPAAPAGAYLRGITIEPIGDDLTLIRFEAAVPAKGSQELVSRLLQAAAGVIAK